MCSYIIAIYFFPNLFVITLFVIHIQVRVRIQCLILSGYAHTPSVLHRHGCISIAPLPRALNPDV